VGNYSSANENIIFIAPAQDIKDRKLLFTTQNGMMKLVDATEFDVTKKTVAATKLAEDDKLLSITVTDAMEKAVAESLSEDVIEPVMLSGGFDDGFDGGMDDGGFGGGFDDGFGMDFGFDGGMQMQFGLEEETAENGEEGIFTNEIVVLQTAKGMFLRFPLREIPEKKKCAIGVRGIKLDKDDYITDVYVLDAGDNLEVDFKGKKVELRKLKTTKRDGKGTKVR
jgi:DNA gyrase subunit A